MTLTMVEPSGPVTRKHSPQCAEPFQQVYASLGNAQMRLRAGLQREVEQMSERIGLPTRSEMDAAHRRIADQDAPRF